MKKTRTRDLQKNDFHGYLKTAIEYVDGSKDHYSKSRFIACCGDAVHGMIAASDALTIFFLGKKSIGTNHLDAIKLLRQVSPSDDELNKQLVKFQRVLGLKSTAEYGGGRVDQKDAEGALRDAEKFLLFVRHRLAR